MNSELRVKPNTVWCPMLKINVDASTQKQRIKETGWVNIDKVCKKCDLLELIDDKKDVYCTYQRSKDVLNPKYMKQISQSYKMILKKSL